MHDLSLRMTILPAAERHLELQSNDPFYTNKKE